MKKECLFTAEQKQVVIENYYEFGKYFDRKNLIKDWSQTSQTEFCNRLKNRPVKNQSKQLGILFAYHIITKNYDYFINNKTFDFQRYFTMSAAKGWSGFVYFIFQELKKLQTAEEVTVFFDNLYDELFNK